MFSTKDNPTIEYKNLSVSGLTSPKKPGTLNTSDRPSFLSRINPFRKPTITEDAEFRIKMAAQTIRQCESIIQHAEYIKHLAEAEQNSVAQWLSNKDKPHD